MIFNVKNRPIDYNRIPGRFEGFGDFMYLCTMKKAIITAFLTAVFCLNTAAGNGNNKIVKGFSGGMMVHTGYLSGYDNPYNYDAAGATFGIGGVAKVHLSKHFRFCFEGYFSSMGLHENIQDGSFNKVFWTGLLGDWFWKIGKVYPYIGATVGGGMETSFYIFEGDRHDWLPEPSAVFHKQPFLAVDPFVGVEYKVGEALRLTLKADWLLAFHSEGLNRPMGPRLYFGCIFAH